MSEPSCPQCHSLQPHRIRQEGFWQRAVLQKFGFYPWECRFCKAVFVLKDRGLSKRGRRRARAEEDHPADSRLDAHPAD